MKESKRISEDMFEKNLYDRTQIGGERQRAYDNNLKESISKYIRLINNLSSLSNSQLMKFVNMLYINNPEMFDSLKKVTEWEYKILLDNLDKI